MSLLEQVLAFHGSFRFPLAHVTNAYVSNRHDLELQWRLLGTGAGSLKTAGIFTTPDGIIFCDLTGNGNYLVIETRGERFARLAFTLDSAQEPGAMAEDIRRRAGSPGAERNA